jgi:hypothetical protein
MGVAPEGSGRNISDQPIWPWIDGYLAMSLPVIGIKSGYAVSTQAEKNLSKLV